MHIRPGQISVLLDPPPALWSSPLLFGHNAIVITVLLLFFLLSYHQIKSNQIPSYHIISYHINKPHNKSSKKRDINKTYIYNICSSPSHFHFHTMSPYHKSLKFYLNNANPKNKQKSKKICPPPSFIPNNPIHPSHLFHHPLIPSPPTDDDAIQIPSFRKKTQRFGDEKKKRGSGLQQHDTITRLS